MLSNEELVKLYQDTRKPLYELKLLKNNEALIRSYVKMFVSPEYSKAMCEFYNELYCEGQVLFLECVRKFDTSKNIKFSTYVSRSLYRKFREIQKKRNDDVQYTVRITQKNKSKVDSIMSGQYSAVSYEPMDLFETRDFLKVLSGKELEFVKKRYGLGKDKKCMSYAKIAKGYNCSKQNVHQTIKRAIVKIKTYISNICGINVAVDDII